MVNTVGSWKRLVKNKCKFTKSLKKFLAWKRGKNDVFWLQTFSQLNIKMIISSQSESQSFAQSWFFNIFMNMLWVNGVFNHFLCAEWCISCGVEICRSLVKSTFSLFPAFDFIDLHMWNVTVTCFWFYGTCKMRPKEGMTLILMDLRLEEDGYPSGP